MLKFQSAAYIQAHSPEEAEAALVTMKQALIDSGFKGFVVFDDPKPLEAAVGEEIVVYTDGGCDARRGGVGAWAFIARIPGQPPLKRCEAVSDTTNNRMEMQAVIEALKVLEIGQKIVIYSDSEYVIKGATQWARNWVRNGWMTAGGSPVKNVEIWQELLALYQLHDVRFVHVKGHSGVEDNEWCDQACTEAMQTLHKQTLAMNT
ncbi:ribonuclease HI [Rhodobacter phage RcZahn]|nr:ribonuclease HI [Rhodobacter phage RcZahn]